MLLRTENITTFLGKALKKKCYNEIVGEGRSEGRTLVEK